MSNLSPRRFSNPDTLKRIGGGFLIELLAPYRKFLASRWVALPQRAGASEIDYEGLANVLMTPETDTPDDLAETLYYLHEMSTPSAMDQLLDAIEENSLDINVGDDPAPADVAVKVWLTAPDLVREKHAEQYLTRARSFISFVGGSNRLAPFHPPNRTTIQALQESMDAWFERKKRGRSSRIFVYHRENLCWFLVRHGEPYKREGSIKDGESGSVYYRPEKHDVLIYVPSEGELRVHAASKGERELYRKMFGLHLFGQEDFFTGAEKYTLEPLKTDGRNALVCSDIKGVDSIVLKEIEFTVLGLVWEREIHKADDVFTAFEDRVFEIPKLYDITRASFKVRFSDSKKARTVTIRPSNNAQYGRDEDSLLVEQWLNARGFIVSEKDDEEDNGIMAKP